MAATALTDPDLDDFLDEVGWQRSTLVVAHNVLTRWHVWLTARGVKVLDADRKDLRAYLAGREAAGKAPSTRKKEWQVVVAFYRWAATPAPHGAGLLDADPMVTVRPPKVSAKPTTRRARDDEVDRLIAHIAATARLRRGGGEAERARRNLAMVSLMFRSGCRVGELPGIDLDDVVERPDGRIVIKLWPDATKAKEPRLIPLEAETARYLHRYLKLRGRQPGPLFVGRERHTRARDRRLQTRAVQDVIYRAAAAAGVPVSAHQLRRGFTSNYLRRGGDVLSLEVVGGWSDHRMPRRYLADDEAEAALERFWDVTDRRRP